MAIRVYRVAVVGCPRAVITNEGSFQGVGKSCLCNRFVRPEAYTEGHDSVLSKDDWTERPIYNGDHFIYWGAANKHLQDGTKVRFQVVEQTEFYELNDSNRLCAHPATEDYMTRASAVRFQSHSRGKVAYRLHAEEIFARRGASAGPIRATQLFPNEDFGGKGKQGIYGYVCVFDPTLEDEQMKRQEAYVTELLHILAKKKRKVVLACVKCDAVDDMKIRHGANLSTYALKKQLPFIEVSAREAVNVEEVFFSLVGSPKKHKLPKGAKRTSPSSWLTYRAVLDTRKHDINRARDAYRKLLQKRVTDFSVTWSEVFPALEREPEFSLVLQIAGAEGKEIVKKMFCLRLIEIKLMEASKQFGLISARKKLDKDHSRSYQDYLSRAFKEHPDLGSESLYDYVYSPGASLAGDVTHSPEEGHESLTEPSTPNTSSNRDTPDSANLLSPVFMTNGSTVLVRPRSSTAAEFYHTGNKSPTGSYHSSTLPRPSKYYSHETLSIDQQSPKTKHFSFVHQSPAHVENDKPPPLPPRDEGGVMGRPLSKQDPTVLSQPFLEGKAKPIGTMKMEGELRRLSSSMDCLLLPDEEEGASKKNSFSRLQAEPYLQPRDVQKVLGTLPPLPPLPPLPDAPRRGNQSSIFRSMRWTSTQPRLPLPQLDSSDSPTVARSGSMKVRGHRRTRSDHLILEQSDTIPPTPPPRDKNLLPPIPPRDTNTLPPIPPRDTPKHSLSNKATPPPSSASSQGLKSPIESSLDFPQTGKEGFRRLIPTNNGKSPRVSRNGEEEDGDNVSNISGPFEEISDGDKSTNELEESSEMTFRNRLERAGTPSDRSTMSSRTYTMPGMTDDDDYAQIEEYQQYMPMASVTVATNRRGTFVGGHELEEPGMKKFHPNATTMTQLRDTPTKKELPSNLSAPALAWGKFSSIWKKQQIPTDSSIREVMESPSPPPSQSYTHASTLPSPYRHRMRSPLPEKQRPLPPSPKKPIHMSSDGLTRKVSGNDSSNIYEVIDEDLVNRVTGRKTSSAMGRPVPQWAPPVDPLNMGKYLEVVQTFFSIPEVHKKWVETVSLVLPDVDPQDYPPPFYSPPSEGKEPDTTQIQGEPIEPLATKLEPDTSLVQEQKQLSPRSIHDDNQIPIHLSDSDTAPNLTMPISSPLQQLKRSPFPSPHVARNSPHLVKKVASRDSIIEQLNRQLRGDSDSDTDEDEDSDDSDTDSDSDSDMDQVTDYQHRSLVHPHRSDDHTEQIEILTTDQASALTTKSSPIVHTDLDVALSHLRTSISTDSDLVEPDSAAKSPLSSNTEDVNRYFTSSNEITVTGYSAEMLSAVPRREKRKGELSNGPRKLSDSGISNCHSQTFEDEQNNEESEC